jgi:hypothetical protein
MFNFHFVSFKELCKYKFLEPLPRVFFGNQSTGSLLQTSMSASTQGLPLLQVSQNCYEAGKRPQETGYYYL